MSRIIISALGPLLKNIPTQTEVEITTGLSAYELVEQHFGIPKTEARMTFVVNGRMQNGNYKVQDGDKIKVLKMGGAG